MGEEMEESGSRESPDGAMESREKASPGKPDRQGIWVNGAMWAAAFLLILSIVVLSSVPPVSRDALIHHLAIPKLYLRHGAMVELPHLPFSYYPMNVDLLYLIPLYLNNDIAAKWIHFSFAVLTAALIFSYLRRKVGTGWGWLGATFFLSIPVVVKLSTTAYVDLGLVFFSTASLLVLLRWLHGGGRTVDLVFSGALCGLAMGTKYNGIIPFVILSLFLPYLASRSPSGDRAPSSRAMGATAVFVLTALLVFSPWMIRNYCWTGNPVYPLYDRWFNGPGVDTGSAMGTFAFRSLVHGESWWEIALLPLRVFLQGQDGSPKYFDGQLNPFLLVFPWLAFFKGPDLSRPWGREIKVFGLYSALLLLITLFSSEMRIRYVTPILPPLVILSIFGCRAFVYRAAGLSGRSGRIALRTLIFFCMGLAVFWNGIYLFRQYRIVDPVPYLAGAVTRDAYIERHRPEYPVMVFANTTLPSDARILLVFLGDRGYYCNRDYLPDMRDKRSILQDLVKEAAGADEVSEGLRQMGITHLMIHLGIFDRWAKESLDRKEMAVLRSFFRERTKTLKVHEDYALFAVG